MNEINRICGRVAPAERELLRLEIRNMMVRAQRGLLVWADSGERGDVSQMRIKPLVLEMRMGRQNGALKGGTLHVRLYFSEPAEHDGMLLALLLEAKRPGRIGLDEQDEHAKKADARLVHWSKGVS